jgi:hypothetical protein
LKSEDRETEARVEGEKWEGNSRFWNFPWSALSSFHKMRAGEQVKHWEVKKINHWFRLCSRGKTLRSLFTALD